MSTSSLRRHKEYFESLERQSKERQATKDENVEETEPKVAKERKQRTKE